MTVHELLGARAVRGNQLAFVQGVGCGGGVLAVSRGAFGGWTLRLWWEADEEAAGWCSLSLVRCVFQGLRWSRRRSLHAAFTMLRWIGEAERRARR